MTIDWDMVQFKRKIIDNARYLFSNYIDTSKGLEPLYNRPEVSSEKAKCYKNFNLIRLTGSTSGEHIIAWKIDDASNINKLYVRGKISVITEWDGSLAITDSTLKNCIFLTIIPNGTNWNFEIDFRINGSKSIKYKEPFDLSIGQFCDIEGVVDFRDNTISVARDNVEKTVLPIDTFPSFNDIYVGLKAYESGDIPNVLGKDIFITWE